MEEVKVRDTFAWLIVFSLVVVLAILAVFLLSEGKAIGLAFGLFSFWGIAGLLWKAENDLGVNPLCFLIFALPVCLSIGSFPGVWFLRACVFVLGNAPILFVLPSNRQRLVFVSLGVLVLFVGTFW